MFLLMTKANTMRGLKLPTILIITTSLNAFAAIPIDGLYLNGFGGAAFIPSNINVTYNNALINQSSYNGGFTAGGALGFKSAFWRYEAEVGYINAQFKNIAVDNIRYNLGNGYNQSVLALANLIFDLPYKPTYMLQPYVGGGIGYAWVQNYFTTPAQLNFSANNYSFAYQGIAGVSFHFSENYSLNVDYRYVGTTHLDTTGNIFQANLVTAGITYRYDGCEYK
jgi:opacity protein-like surface antigen